MSKFIIGAPYIELKEYEEGRAYRLSNTMTYNGKTEVVFVEVEEEYGKYLCAERSDAFVLLALPIALREGCDIYTETPITEILLHNIREILIPHLLMGDPNCKSVQIHAPTVYEDIGGVGVGTGISCGVDSTYTVKEYTNKMYEGMQLTHLFIGCLNRELWDYDATDNLFSWREKHKRQFERFNVVSEELDLPLVTLFTNFVKFVTKNDYIKKHVHVHHYITMAAILSLKKLWKIYYFAASETFYAFKLDNHLTDDPDRYELLLMHVFSTNDFLCYSGGAKSDRIVKTKELADFDLAQKILHPCHTKQKKNCSLPSCDKCLRGLLTLDYYDKLDAMKDVFHVDLYKQNRMDYFVRLASRRDNKYLKELYEMLSEKYPDKMKKATQIHEKSMSTIPKKKYDVLKTTYSKTLKLLSVGNPKETILEFFKNKNIRRIGYIGTSNFGEQILNLVKDEIICTKFKSSDINQYDGIYILSISKSDIDKSQRDLNTELPVVTNLEIFEYIDSI